MIEENKQSFTSETANLKLLEEKETNTQKKNKSPNIVKELKIEKAKLELYQADREKHLKLLENTVNRQVPKDVKGVDYEAKSDIRGGGINQSDASIINNIYYLRCNINKLEYVISVLSECFNNKVRIIKEYLNEEEGKIFEMRFIKEKPIQVIANELGYCYETIKLRLRTIKKKLSDIEDYKNGESEYIN